MKFKMFAASVALTLGLSGVAQAAAINIAGYSTVGRHVIDFEDVAGTNFPGTTYNGILSSGGATFAERFEGQTLSFVTDNVTGAPLDVLSGTPAGPLTLAPGAAGRNLAIGTDSTKNLLPCGDYTCADPNGYGEGSFAVLFSGGVSYFGMQQLFGHDTSKLTTLDFFNSSGGLIQRVTVNVTSSFVAFSREGGVKDIAGVSVFTRDPGGLSYDNLVYDTPAAPVVTGVPEPATWTLLIGGFGFAGTALRRRRTFVGTGPATV
ncbi:PEPxxWA-CTERM sorting domain-containing protein [Phenylobacterium kunshanense]|nr:PEPxxWA-CTERM sorting domain-containing protein [Phenylobacterium kunshanense]